MRNVGFLNFRAVAIACFAFAAAALAGCAEKRGGSIPYNVSDFGAPDAPSVVALDSGYRIAPMDTLAVRIFGMTDLTGEYQVDLRGNLSLPLIGDVAALNMTPAELDALLTRKYSRNIWRTRTSASGSRRRQGATSPSTGQ